MQVDSWLSDCNRFFTLIRLGFRLITVIVDNNLVRHRIVIGLLKSKRRFVISKDIHYTCLAKDILGSMYRQEQILAPDWLKIS